VVVAVVVADRQQLAGWLAARGRVVVWVGGRSAKVSLRKHCEAEFGGLALARSHARSFSGGAGTRKNCCSAASETGRRHTYVAPSAILRQTLGLLFLTEAK
jgi:hypothetical protein